MTAQYIPIFSSAGNSSPMTVTLHSPRLSTLKEEFDRTGFCIADNLFSEDNLQEIETFFEDFKTSGGKVFDQDKVYEEVDPTKSQVRARQPHRYSRKVTAWMTHPAVAEVLEVLLGQPPLGAQTMYYYKPPGAKGQAMHQDNFYLLAQPSTCIAAWTPIDSADEENGCLYIAPKSQEFDIICPEKGAERWMNYGEGHITKFPRETKPVAVPVKRGQTLFFGGNVIHGSGPNRSKTRSRRTFIGHYVDNATESLARHYHPVINMQQEIVSGITIHEGGGPCGDDWQGADH